MGNVNSLESAPLVRFSVFGCSPYDESDIPPMKEHLEAASNRVDFQFHLGDIFDADGYKNGDLPEDLYVRTRDLLISSEKPVFIVPGDNEWNAAGSPSNAYDTWLSYFNEFEAQWDDCPETIHDSELPSNFRFVSNGVLVIGISLPGHDYNWPHVFSEHNWEWIQAKNYQWINECFAQAEDDVVAAVILSQDGPHQNGYSPRFMKEFPRIIRKYKRIPKLFLWSNHHVFMIDRRFASLAHGNLTSVCIDQTIEGQPPLVVEVFANCTNPFRFSQTYWL